jgi:hypothetical protein
LYAGSKLDLHGYDMKLNAIRMDSKNDTVSYAIINKGGTLAIDSVVHIKRINYDYWYPFSLPYDCKINTIRQLNGKTMGKYEDGNNMSDSKWGIKYYDGRERQASNSFAGVGNASPHWKWMPADGTLKANVGYIIGMFDEPANYGDGPGQFKEHRSVFFPPLSGSEYTESNEGAKTATVYSWYVAMDGDKQNRGWNFIGLPYISLFDPGTSDSGYQGVNNASVMITGKVGTPEYIDQPNVYVSIPDGAASRTYTQKLAKSTKLEPFRGYFVQVIDPPSTEDKEWDIYYDFKGRALPSESAPRKALKATKEINFEILFGNDDKSDNAGFIIEESHSTEYEIGDDLIKMNAKADKPQIYSQAGGYNLAYNALSADDANYIPLVLYTPGAGTYTIRLEEYSNVSGAETIELLRDGEPVADLLFDTYEIQATAAGTMENYALRVVARQVIETSIEEVQLENIPEGATIQIYDILGRLVETRVAERNMRLDMPTTGVYTIVVRHGDAQKVLKTVIR